MCGRRDKLPPANDPMKTRSFLSLLLLTLASCATVSPGSRTRSVFHAYEHDAGISFITLADGPGSPKVAVMSIGGLKGESKREISAAEFESIWNTVRKENLERFRVKSDSEDFNTSDNYVLRLEGPGVPASTYVVPKPSASPSLKAVVKKIRGYNRI